MRIDEIILFGLFDYIYTVKLPIVSKALTIEINKFKAKFAK